MSGMKDLLEKASGTDRIDADDPEVHKGQGGGSGWKGFFKDHPKRRAKLFIYMWYLSFLMLIGGVLMMIYMLLFR